MTGRFLCLNCSQMMHIFGVGQLKALDWIGVVAEMVSLQDLPNPHQQDELSSIDLTGHSMPPVARSRGTFPALMPSYPHLHLFLQNKFHCAAQLR